MSFTVSPREVAFYLNATACVGRCLLAVDPLSTYRRYPLVVSQAVLLRLPQLLWVIAVANLGIVWTFVAKSFAHRLDDLGVVSRRLYCAIISCVTPTV